MSEDTIIQEDIEQAVNYETLGPAYFTARRLSEQIMQGVEAEPFKKVVDKTTEQMREGLYTYVEDFLRSDLESNLQDYLTRMVERTVCALLTGEQWALNQYPLGKHQDGEQIRAAVAKHGGEPLLMARLADLEKEVARLAESLKWYRDR